ncbi:MAG TPA: gamma-glutamyltransferase [Gemmatimonadaceae bacterium]|jgi:gamma-glutamyltranspeptidase
MHLLLAVAFFFQAAAADTATLHGARGPAFAPDGRLAVSVNGDIFAQQSPGGHWLHLTSGIAWDRDPVWTRDGSAIVFSSDRSGQYAIWRVKVSADGTAGTPERITNSNEPESSPSVAADGTIAFARGEGNASRVWIHTAAGAEQRLDGIERTEVDPAYSPDGSRVAFIETNETGRRVLVRGASDSRETVANSTSNAERLAWSPAGDRIAFTAGNRGGVYVAPTDGRWTNFVSAKHGDIAWSQDGKIAIVEHDDANVAYNGDPDRLGERIASEDFESKENLYFVNAPPPPDAGLAEQTIIAERNRAERYGEAYDRVWERSTKLYFSQPDAAARLVQWQAAKAKHRPEALAAKHDDELQAAIYAMLRERPATRSSATGRAAVSSAHPVATAAGIEILKDGGNVVDAAVAVSFTLGVVEPDASGVGGYGQMVINLAKMEKPTLIEFMTRVPEDATLSNTSMLINGRYPPDGAALVNVPGTVAGMYRAFKEYGSGKIAWKDILAPAIRAATNGYVLSEGTATTFSTEREHFLKYEGSRALFFNKDGTPKVAGDTIKNPDLAWVLGKIAAGGADGFYTGEVAQKWVSDLRAHGNTMKLSDLARYFAPEREPVSGTYRGYTFYASAPPVSGGAEMAGKLNLLEHFEKPKLYTEDAATLHAIVTAWLLVPSTRNRIADPDLWPTDIAPIISKDTADLRWRCYDANKALTPTQLRGDVLACAGRSKIEDGGSKMTSPQLSAVGNLRSSNLDLPSSPCGPDHATEITHCHSSGTTAFTVADNEGNVVAVTQTLGTWGGDFYVTPGLGFLSNDKLTSYGTDSTQYGSRLAFARHGSTITPTIVFKGKKPVFAVGAAGNNWITSAVFETLLGALDYGLGPQQALELPRFIPGVAFGGGGRGGRGGAAAAPARYNIEMEDGFSPEVIKKLRELGYDISYVSMRGELREGYGAAVAIDGKKVTAGADPRRAGTAGAIP